MNFFETQARRKILFASLYLSEGAPIGFLWLALPTRLRILDVPVEKITWLTAMLVLPWTFKFMWAPMVDVLRGDHWTLRHWIVAAQCMMGLTLLPLLWLDPRQSLGWLAATLMVHALSAATQDVAIDALCISSTEPDERGQYNGWMQAGMLIGRALMGGGALVMASWVGDAAVVVGLILLTTFSMLLVMQSKPPGDDHSAMSIGRWNNLRQTLGIALLDRNTWLGLLFALSGGAAFKSLEVIYGPFLVDRGFEQASIGWFSAGPMIGAMIVGSLLGGWLTDRLGPRRCVSFAMIAMAGTIGGLALTDYSLDSAPQLALLTWLVLTAFGIGVFTASSYALLMNISRPAIAATQFSTFMGATNGCESWSSYTSGWIIQRFGYAEAMLVMCAASLLALPLLGALRVDKSEDQMDDMTMD